MGGGGGGGGGAQKIMYARVLDALSCYLSFIWSMIQNGIRRKQTWGGGGVWNGIIRNSLIERTDKKGTKTVK